MKRLIRAVAARSGYAIQPANKSVGAYEPKFSELRNIVRPFTMTSAERLNGLYRALHYISARKIGGDFVECGVWRGGSSIFAALTMAMLNDRRKLHLYDTFEGMTAPTQDDVDHLGHAAQNLLDESKRVDGGRGTWAYASLNDVKANIRSCKLQEDQFNMVIGKVEETIPRALPEKISILRLDTDWYESTLHELKWLYPKLQPGGVLIVDDYGHWEGARKAVDEFFSTSEKPILLTHMDYTGVIGVKV